MSTDSLIKFISNLLDLLQTDGGHIALALVLMFCGLFILGHYGIAVGKDLFIWALGVLGYALKNNGGAPPKNG